MCQLVDRSVDRPAPVHIVHTGRPDGPLVSGLGCYSTLFSLLLDSDLYAISSDLPIKLLFPLSHRKRIIKFKQPWEINSRVQWIEFIHHQREYMIQTWLLAVAVNNLLRQLAMWHLKGRDTCPFFHPNFIWGIQMVYSKANYCLFLFNELFVVSSHGN